MLYLALIAPLLYSAHLGTLPFRTYEKQETVHIADTKETEHTQGVTDNVACSCVAYVRARGGDIPLVDASEMRSATTTPYVGGVALMYYPHSGMWHVAYIEAVHNTYIVVAESNDEPCSITRRTIALPHNRIVGYL